MNKCRTSGIVLNVYDHGESNKIITFFSSDLGKVTGIAKGAKRSKKRFVNKLEEFSLLQLMYSPPKRDGMLFIHEAELDDAFLSLRAHYNRYVAATYIIELTLRFTRDHDPDPFIYSLLLWALGGLDADKNPLQICTFFHLRILGAAGYQPTLDSCGFCGEILRSNLKYSLHSTDGSLLCAKCRGSIKGGNSTVTVQTIKFLQHAQRVNLASLDRLKISQKNINESLRILHNYTLHLLQHEIHSWQQVKGLQNQTPFK